MRNSSRFLRQVRRSFKQVKWAKSLGYSHNLHKQNRSALQNQRVDKACQTLKRIANLPIPFHKRQTHIHANAHSQWLHGTDVQAPSSRKLMSLRSAVLGCLFSKQNRMRSPYLFFATHENVFLDPFARWVLHVFSKLRRISFSNSQLVVKVLKQVASRRSKPVWGENGVVAIVSLLCHELQWQVQDADLFIFSTFSGDNVNLKQTRKPSSGLTELAFAICFPGSLTTRLSLDRRRRCAKCHRPMSSKDHEHPSLHCDKAPPKKKNTLTWTTGIVLECGHVCAARCQHTPNMWVFRTFRTEYGRHHQFLSVPSFDVFFDVFKF